jgi:chemotaxis protein methyltransferase CheR
MEVMGNEYAIMRNNASIMNLGSSNARMTKADFEKLSSFIYDQYGIKMPLVKKTLLESRLHKRLNNLNITNFKEYIDLVVNAKQTDYEILGMVNAITTNKTEFFREAGHFDFLTSQVLPELSERNNKQVKLWSAGCSSGEEVYTLAMVLSEFSENNSSIDYSILGTDISTDVLDKSVSAIYPEERIEALPLFLKRKYFLKSKVAVKRTVRVVPELRKKVNFQRLNFMDASYPVNQVFDVIFCRNVLIYFDKPTQEKVIRKLCEKLYKGAWLFLGHSESITGLNLPLEQIKPTVFRKI